MKYLRLTGTDPFYNLATEEYLFRATKDDVFMLWQNDRTVVVGKNQNIKAEVNLDYTDNEGIRVVRRITGGGAVYHDLGNLNYTFISNEGGEIDFKRFTMPIIDALLSLGVKAELSGRNDLEVGGRKFSGNAQSTDSGRVLHHGTLLFDTDLTVLEKALLVDREKIRAHSLTSVRSRVLNLKEVLPTVPSASCFGDLIEKFIDEKYGMERLVLSDGDLAEIEKIHTRITSREWLYPDEGIASRYHVKRTKRFDFGRVEIHLDMSADKIRSARILGDFFGKRPVTELEASLSGLKKGDSIKLSRPIGDYILGMTERELLDLLFKE